MSQTTANGRTQPGLVASPRHTVLLIAILLLVAAAGAISRPTRSAATSASLLPTYLSVLVAELLLLYFTWRGIRRSGTALSDLVGGRWSNPRDVALDLLIAAALWGALSLFAMAWTRL